MSSLGFGLAGSRALPRGKGIVGSSKPPEHRKDVTGERRDAERAAASPAAGRPRVFMDIEIDGKPIGRAICELYSDIVPRTAENFRLLCTGSAGLGLHGKPLHYKGCPFHRVIPNFTLQGGDIIKGDGTSGESAYGAAFDDESFDLRHSSAGLLSMANTGPNTNNSQFYILSKPAPSLDKNHVVFGRVVDGMDVVRRVEACCGVEHSGNNICRTPRSHEVVAFRPGLPQAYISDCGELPQEVLAIDDDAPAGKRPRQACPGSEEVHIFHILKKHAGLRYPQTWQGKHASCTKAKAKVALEGLRKRLVASASVQTTFVELAREHSDEVTAQNGGDLGLVERGALAKEVEQVAFALVVGGISEVFETRQGVHLLLRTA